MRKSISFYLLPVLLTVLCLSSCSETGQKTEYTHVIPANATEVAALDLKSIVDKAGLNTSDSRATLQKFLGLLLEGGSANLKQEAETLLKDPAESGIDWNAPLYVFEAPTLHNTAITLKIADLKKFEAMLRLLVQEQLCTAPVEAGGYRSVEIKDAGVLLAYNDGTLLGVYGGSTEQLKKLQNADFKGNTKESNQPFHPQNSRELQQAMLNMMHGRAFNISLTSNELLTLSNLRVLMEYAPNEPEVNILYQLIMKIEELNLRGDKNRTNFTVVLNEKNENALKQLTDFAKLFIGM